MTGRSGDGEVAVGRSGRGEVVVGRDVVER